MAIGRNPRIVSSPFFFLTTVTSCVFHNSFRILGPVIHQPELQTARDGFLDVRIKPSDHLDHDSALAIFCPRGAAWWSLLARAMATLIRAYRKYARRRRSFRLLTAPACSAVEAVHIESIIHKRSLCKPGQHLRRDLDVNNNVHGGDVDGDDDSYDDDHDDQCDDDCIILLMMMMFVMMEMEMDSHEGLEVTITLNTQAFATQEAQL